MWQDRGRVGAWLASAWASLLMLAPPSAAPEQPLERAITTGGSVACIDASSLARRVASWSGHRTVPDGVAIAIEHEPQRMVLRIAGLAASDVERSFDPPPPRCRDAEIAVAVALAVALDGEAVVERLVEPGGGARRYEGPTEVVVAGEVPRQESVDVIVRADAEPRSVAPSRDRRGVPDVELALAAGGSIGVLVRAGFESALELRLRWRPIALAAGADVGARNDIALGTSGGVVDVVRVAGRLGLCLPIDRGRFTLAICAGGSAGGVRAEPRRTAAPRSSTVPWAALAGGMQGAVRLSARWSLVLENDVVFAFVRPAIVATDLQTGVATRLSTPAIGWRGVIGVAVRVGGVARRAR